MNRNKDIRFTIRMKPLLHEWFKGYAQRTNTTMSTLVIEYIESLRNPQAAPTENVHEPQYEHPDRLEEKNAEIQRLHTELERRDGQIESALRSLDHAQQLLAVQTKNNAALTDRLKAIEDQRNRSWWRKLFYK